MAVLLPAAAFAAAFALRGTPPPAAPDSVPVTHAVRAEVAPVIDGRENDAVWARAPEASDFQEFMPHDGGAPRFRTSFKIAYDDRNFYVFIRAFDPHPDSIMRALSRRDVRGPSDQLKIIIDAYYDRRSGVELAVNPDGVKRDYAIYNDIDEDESWDGVWDVGTSVDSLGWTAEYRVPLSQLRYADRASHTFGFGIWRDIERYKERVSWPRYRNSEQRLASQLGRVVDIEGIASFRRAELTPYVVTKNETRATGPTSWDRVQKATAGADLKLGLGPNMTLDATVNPDFGQVEADPAVLNLSAFETFYEEKRPFFLEGTGLYRFQVDCNIVNCGGEGLFYSRRIGRSPTIGDYAGPGSPTSTPILAAGKLTGRLGSGLSIGVLDAATDRVQGTETRTMEPRTNYAVVRAKQDLRGGESGFGFIATAVNRSLDAWTRDALAREAYVFGTEFRHRFPGRHYELAGSLTRSQVRGAPTALLGLQTDGVHAFQRPDDRLAVDPTRTSLAGDAEEVSLTKLGGGIVRFQTSYARLSPGYDVNDLGYLRRADQQQQSNWFALQFRNPTRWFKSLQLNFNEWNFWTASGLTLEHGVNFNWHLNLPNNWWAHVGSTYNGLWGSFCDRCARGGPAVRTSPSISPWIGFNGDDRKSVVPSLFLNTWFGNDGHSDYMSLNPSMDFRPSARLQASVGAQIARNHDDAQWYGLFFDGTTPHYSFARLEQNTVSVATRWSYTATPNLTFQLYAEPFVSKGRWSDVRELSATPRAERYDDRYQPFVPPPTAITGFDAKQLHSNTVMRWEYRPGSSVYLVWAHGRDDFLRRPSDRSWRGEFDDLFALHPDNTFLIKVAHWLNY